MDWTERQKDAIGVEGRSNNKNLLVAAAAGSGKTAVLVERIKRLIIEEQVPIDQFLVVTYTNAAAAEMKEKLVKAIREEIVKDTDPNSETAKFLQNQLADMYKADISTFHSFAIKVCRRFFNYLDIDPGAKVLDGIEADVLKQDAMEDTFENFFAKGDKAFMDFLYRYGDSKNEDILIENLLKTYNKLRSIPNYWDWLDEAEGRLQYTAEDLLQEPAIHAFVHTYCQKAFMQAIHLLEQVHGLLESEEIDCLVEKTATELAAVREMAAVDDLSQLYEQVNGFALASTFSVTQKYYKEQKGLSPKDAKERAEAVNAIFETIKEDCKGLRDQAKEALGKIKSLFSKNLERETWLLGQTVESAHLMRLLLEDFEERYRAAKKKKGAIDFGDMEHYCLQALAHEEVRRSYRDQYAYIFIDEYQDSNYLQEAIISQICREDNLFMVGDVKQSIYRFRMAVPDIFLEKYTRFSDLNNGAESRDCKIDLNENFRSKQPIIDGVNFLFKELMEGYDDNAALKKGVFSKKDIAYPPEFHVVRETKPAEEEVDGSVDEAIADMVREQKEAYRVCDIIRSCLGKPYYDPKTDTEKTVKLRDIVLLMKSVKNGTGTIYKEVLAESGYGAYIEESSGYFDTIEVQAITDLLTVLDNGKKDIPLLGVLRSFLFHFTIEELVQIRIFQKQTPFYASFFTYAKEGPDENLQEKCAGVLAKLEEWRSWTTYLPLDEIMGRIINDTGFYAYMGAISGGAQRQANLRAFIDRAIAFQSKGRRSVADLLRYIAALKKKKDTEIGQVSLLGENDNVVRITTIHKSKGLEFPVVIVCGLGRGFKNGDDNKLCRIDRDFGLALRYVDEKAHYKEKGLLWRLIDAKNKLQEREERIRVLYVALTRARDRLFMVATPSGKKLESYYQYMYDILKENGSPVQCFEIQETELNMESNSSHGSSLSLKEWTDSYLQNRNEKAKAYVENCLAREYSYQEDLTTPSKYNVTQLNTGQLEKRTAMEMPAFMEQDEGTKGDNLSRRGAKFGTILHRVEEYLDIVGAVGAWQEGGEKMAADFIESSIEDLQGREILSAEEAQSADRAMLLSFVKSDLAARIAASPSFKRETHFTYRYQEEEKEYLVQGAIDAYFEEEGALVLLDYKSNTMRKGETEEAFTVRMKEDYATQMKIYGAALSDLTGKPIKESYLYLLRYGKLIDMK